MAKSSIVVMLTLLLLLGGAVGACGGQNSETPKKDTAEQHIELGYKLYAMGGGSSKAILEYTKAIELEPNNAKAYAGRGDIYAAEIIIYNPSKKKDISLLDLAVADYTKAIELDPNLAVAHAGRAYIYDYKKQYNLAIADFTKAIEIDPNLAAAYAGRANSYISINQYDLAIADYAKAIEQYDLAIANSSKTTQLLPNLPDMRIENLAAAYADRADAYDVKGDYDLVIADYKKAIEISSEYPFDSFQRDSYQQRYKKSDAYRYRELSGNLPKLVEKDKWMCRFTSKGIGYTMTTEVTDTAGLSGAGLCYVLEASISPPNEYGISKAVTWIDPFTFDMLKIESSGIYQGSLVSLKTSYTYRYATDCTRYPLKVGKELEVEAVAINTMTAMGKTQTTTETNSYTYSVEKIEQIIVPAGAFKCFKIVQHSKTGQLVRTFWVSDQAKHHEVKEIDHETGDVLELVSYSVSR